jgi:hypothetical protein
MAEEPVKQFVKLLHEGNLKQTLSFIKELRKTQSFRDKWKATAWDGWLSALEKSDKSSLLYQMLSGIDDSELAAVLKDFYDIRKKIADKDPTMKQMATGFFGEWIRLIRTYRQMNKEKSEE